MWLNIRKGISIYNSKVHLRTTYSLAENSRMEGWKGVLAHRFFDAQELLCLFLDCSNAI